jgi:hypothetical protein
MRAACVSTLSAVSGNIGTLHDFPRMADSATGIATGFALAFRRFTDDRLKILRLQGARGGGK